MARKKPHEEHENHERWLVSYADFITLLFAFFVVMYAISQVDNKKLGKLARSMQSAFDIRAINPANQKLTLADGVFQGTTQPIAPLVLPSNPTPEEVQEEIKKQLQEADSLDKVHFKQDERGLTISLVEAGFFDPGAAAIKSSSVKILEAIAQVILPLPNQIRIEGHTDNTPIHTAQFPSNWELSTARATSVIAYLTTHFKVEPFRLSAAGYGEYRPTATNSTPEGRAANRRVDIIVLNGMAARLEPR
jgi:chemotaxis protein MotB